MNHKTHKDFHKAHNHLTKSKLCDLENIRISKKPCDLCVKKLVNFLCLLWFKKLFLSFHKRFFSSQKVKYQSAN